MLDAVDRSGNRKYRHRGIGKGLSAAMTGARSGRRVAAITGGLIGGQLVSIDRIEGIPGFPDGIAGYDLCPMAQEQADAAGVEFVASRCNSIAPTGNQWRLSSDDGDLVARALILATGTAFAKLHVPGEERLSGRGVSECASCDAPLLRNKITVVVGGGDSGMQEALTLADHAAKVVIIERGPALTGQRSYIDRVSTNPKIEFRFNCVVTEIMGEDALSGVQIKDNAAGDVLVFDCAAVFVCVGLVPNTELVRDILQLDESGRIQVDCGMRTAIPGICAAGNVRQSSSHRASGAMGDGAAAAIAVDEYLATGHWPAAK
jgi:thioredoxin reductase (NADPH)